MRKLTLTSLLSIFFLLISFLKNDLSAQTTSLTITYSGFQACGGCTVCGADYYCYNTVSSYCGNTAPCGTQSFVDPVPAGNIITNIQVQYYSADCAGGSLTADINGNPFPTVNEGNSGCLCSNNPCAISASTTNTYPCGIPGYNYGASNNIQLCTGSSVCINKLILIMTYVPANQATPASQPGAISGQTPVCVGSSYTYTIPAVANAAGYTWSFPPGWVINSGQGTTSVNATPGTAGNICVTANNLCGTSAATCFPVTLSTPSTAPISASANPNPICPPATSTLTVTGGSLGAGASWTWFTGSCGGAVVGTGTTITVSPASTTTYFVGATGGCGSTSCVSTVVNVGGAPVVPGAIAGTTSVCNGSSQTYSIGAVAGASGYTWTVPAGTIINSGQGTTSINVTVGGTPGNICVTADNACGSSAQTCTALTITTTPSSPGSISGTTPVCPGNQGYSISGVAGATSYTWSTSAGGSVTGGQGTTSVIVNWTTPGPQTVSVTADNSCGSSSTTTFNVTVNPLPTITAVPTPTAVCVGSSATLNASGGTIYSWSAGTTPTTGASVSVTPASPTTYTVTGTDANGCTNTGTVNVGVNPLPVVTITGNNSICPGQSTTLTGNGATSYSWNTGPLTSTITVTPASTTGYTVTGTDGNNCQNTASVSVTVNPLPTLTMPATQTLTCASPTVTLNGSANPGTSTLAWSNSSGFSSGNPASVSSAGYYVLTATTLQGCSASDSVQVVPSAGLPNANINASGLSITCTTLSQTLTGTSTTPGVTFDWADGGGPIAGNPITVSVAGTYTLTVTDPSNGCTSTTQTSITNNTTPPNASAGPDTVLNCTNANVNLAGSSSTVGSTFSWAGAGIVSGGTTATPNVNAAGQYTLTVTDPSNGCTSTDNADVTLNNTPPNVNAGPDDTLICSSPTITAIGSSSTGGATFQWFDNGGNSLSLVDSVSVGSAGTYYLVVTDPSNGCTSTDSMTVINNPNMPVITGVNNQTINCTTLQASLSASSGANVITWNGPGIGVNSPNGTTVTTGGTFTVTATDPGNGCSSTAPLVVTVDTISPIASAGNPATITCSVSQPTLNGSPAVGVTYNWSGPGVISATSQNTAVNAPGNYTLTVTSTSNGCTGTSGTSVVAVAIDTTSPGANAATLLQVTCTNALASMTGNSGTAGVTYSWSGPGAFSSASQNPSSSTIGVYTVTVTNPANGCTSTDTTSVTSNTTPPNINPGLNDTLPCGAGTVNLNGTSTTGGATFAWTGPAAFASAIANPAVGSTGEYTLTVTDPSNGCTSVDSVNIATSNVVAGFTANPTTGFAPLTVNFTNTSTNANSYAWSFGDGNTSVNVNPSDIYNTSGTYTVILTAINGACMDTATAIIIVNDNSLILIPNVFTPNGDGTNDLFFITTTGISEMSGDILNRWGEKIFSFNGINSSWDGKNLSGANASNGTYYLLLHAKGFDGKTYEREAYIGLFR